MLFRSRHATHARWPFWLLAAAWFCANTPQSVIFAALNWMQEARHFSHQQRLVSEVAQLLGGQARESAAERLAQAPETPRRAPAPAVPPELVLKKIELGEPVEAALGILPRRGATFAVSEVDAPATPAREPLTEPPRGRV